MANTRKGRISGKYIIVFIAAFFWLLAGNTYAAGNKSGSEHHSGEKEQFNAGRMIIDHIIDSHEWHIMDWGETHISVPLPVILWYEGNLHVFMSNKFDHGYSSYKGFKLAKEGEYKGRIVRVKEGTMEKDPNAPLPLDFSITKNVFAIFVSVMILSLIFISLGNAYKRRKGKAPTGFQNLVEPLIIFLRDEVAKAAIGEKKYEKFLPYLLTLFFFIFFNNLLGLVPIFPGGANVTGNLAVTGIMALFTFVITSVSGNKSYWQHIFNTPGVPWWLKIPIPLMPLIEFLGIFIKPFVLMVRLFANITAGHIIVLGFMSLIFIFGNMSPGAGFGIAPLSIAFGIFMLLLELLVAFIQAFVFTLLSALYFGMATEEHH